MKYKQLFDTKHLHGDLKKKSLRSGAITVSSQGIMFVLQIASTMILARILSPQDYGINAMAVSVTGFASMFSNLGLSTATVQRAEINHEQVSTLFWINVAVGALLTLVVALLSPLVAWFYKKPELLWVMLALSAVFFVNGLVVQHSALLTRQMQFYSLAKIQVFSMFAGILVAIVTAKYGFGYWALVLNSLTWSLVNALGIWFSCGWIPGLPHRNAGIRSMIRFGSDLMGFNIINYFSRNLDNVLIGRYHGSNVLGLYSKAYQLLMMPITNLRDPMTSVAMPALSRLQHDQEQFKNYYLKCISLLAFVSMPLVVFLFVCSDQLIGLLLGPQWLGASDIFKILAIAAFFQPVVSTGGMVLLSTGRSRLYLFIGVANAIFISLSFVIGLPWGAKGVATAYALANYLVAFPSLFYAFRDTSICLKEFLWSFIKPFIASIVMGITCFILLRFLGDMNALVQMLVGFAACVSVYVASFSVLSGGGHELQEYYSYGRLILGRKS